MNFCGRFSVVGVASHLTLVSILTLLWSPQDPGISILLGPAFPFDTLCLGLRAPPLSVQASVVATVVKQV